MAGRVEKGFVIRRGMLLATVRSDDEVRKLLMRQMHFRVCADGCYGDV
jgi:hypothetical protein